MTDNTPRLLPRLTLMLAALGLLILQVGFVQSQFWATALWPWPDTPLTYLFVGSILAAVALPVAWVALSGELAALRAGALDFALCYAGISGFLIYFYHRNGVDPLDPINPYLLFTVAGTLLNLLIWKVSRSIDFRNRQPMPALVRWSFLLFSLILISVGTGLLMEQRHIFPWPLKAETSVLIGWIFLGAAVYFLHGFFNPVWSNACGQLLGFMAYDLVLLWPFLKHFEHVKDEHRLSLIIYVGVLTYSLFLAAYFLLLHRRTRLTRVFHA